METGVEDREDMGYEDQYADTNTSYGERYNELNDMEDKQEDIPQDLLAAAGLEDSDAEDVDVTLSHPLSLYVYVHTSVVHAYTLSYICWTVLYANGNNITLIFKS